MRPGAEGRSGFPGGRAAGRTAAVPAGRLPALLLVGAFALAGAALPGPEGSFGAGALAAQELGSGQPGSPLAGGGGPVLQAFRFGDAEAVGIESLTLLTVPVVAGVPLGDRLRAEVHGGWARGSMERADGVDVQVDGLIDTELRLGADLVPGSVRLTGQLVVPTGVDSHSEDELALAGAVAADLLPFRISHWSSGGGGGLSLSAVHSFGATALGMDVGYQRAGEFQPTAAEPAAVYRPGDAVLLTAALDQAVSATAKLTLRLDARRYGEDALDGENLFRSGNRVGATAVYSFARGAASSGVAYAGYRHRSAGTFLVDLAPRPSQGAFLAGAGLRTPVGGGVLTPSADVRVLRREDGRGQGYATSVGAAGEWATGGVTLMPGARLRFGSVLVQEELESGFVGFDLSLQLRRGG